MDSRTSGLPLSILLTGSCPSAFLESGKSLEETRLKAPAWVFTKRQVFWNHRCP
jgi:hypothetical protein